MLVANVRDVSVRDNQSATFSSEDWRSLCLEALFM